LKRLSHEIEVVKEADFVSVEAGSIRRVAKQESSIPSWSENLASTHSTAAEQERSWLLRHKAVRDENPQKGGSNRKECRKSDKLVVVKKSGNADGAKGLE
jgi:hypothetical protein